jgi:glycosyltransferase involved in cell wall biosynthesis
MKIAIFHNFMDNIGGAEIVCLSLARGLNADIYTTNINDNKIKEMGYEDILPRIKSIGKVPKEAPFRQQLTFMRFRHLNLKGKYDFFIIGGDWAISAAVNNKPNMEYFHSPLNEIWAFRNSVRKSLHLWMKPIYQIWTMYLRFIYRIYFKEVEIKVCNSMNTRNRIRKYLKSDAKIIFPPIQEKFFLKNKNINNNGYWLSVNRLVSHKRIEMQLNAFKEIPKEKLIIVGPYDKSKGSLKYKKYLESIKPKNVNIISVDSKNLQLLYKNCKGFITTAIDEDFGMTPLEAMASGKPVIAPNEGGYKETVIDKETGILIDDIKSDKIVEAIKKINKNIKINPQKYANFCIKQAKKFSEKKFIKKIKEEINTA